MSDYEKLTPELLNAAVAEYVMGIEVRELSPIGKPDEVLILMGHVRGGVFQAEDIPPFSTDDNAARLVRDRIRELGKVPQYRHYLAKQIWPADTPFDQFKGADEFAFRFEQATARQQCIAALQALESEQAGRDKA